MRFPLALTAKIAAHIIVNKLRGVEKFATVLQLEPLHTCNSLCTGCGHPRVFDADQGSHAAGRLPRRGGRVRRPMVSICGGEPLIYPEVEALTQWLLRQRDASSISAPTHAMREAARWVGGAARGDAGRVRSASDVGAEAADSLSEELITPKQFEETAGRMYLRPVLISPPIGFFFGTCISMGLERTHDLIVEREGVFAEAIRAIRMAKSSATRWRPTRPSIAKPTRKRSSRCSLYLGTLAWTATPSSPGLRI